MIASPLNHLPAPKARRHLHTRTATFQGFLREDGLWDIEGELVDTKTYRYGDRERGPLEPGHPIHRMIVRISVDNDLIVREAVADMHDIPFSYCSAAGLRVDGLVGARVGKGWRKAVDACLAGTAGCSHLRELIYYLATTAFQTISPFREEHMAKLGPPTDDKQGLPFFLDNCRSWARNSPVVQKYFPNFFQP